MSVKIVNGRMLLVWRSRRTECAVQSFLSGLEGLIKWQRFLGKSFLDGPMWVRSRRTTVLKRVTAVCMEAMPASGMRSSHTPGRSAARVAPRKMTSNRSLAVVMGFWNSSVRKFLSSEAHCEFQ